MGLLSWVRSDPHANLKAVVGDEELPHFPALTLRALELIRDDQSSVNEIADIVAADPGTSVQLLKTVNSAAFSLRRSVESVHQAICLLGRGELESMLISMAVGLALPRGAVLGFEPKRFWATAALRAVVARNLADRLDPSIRSQCFTAALLQDMAVPILAHQRGDDYGRLLERLHAGAENLAEIERSEHDWDHALVATWMCAKWHFPANLTEAIGCHHHTGEAEMTPLPLVCLTARLREVDEERGIDDLIAAAERDHGLGEEETHGIVDDSRNSAGELAGLFF